MTTLAAPRPEIRLVLPEALSSDQREAVLAWLRAVLPGGFVHLAPLERDLSEGLRVFLLPDIVGHVACGLQAGGGLPELLAQWGRLARRAEAAGAEGFVLHGQALAQDPGAVAQALAQWCPAAAGAADVPRLVHPEVDDPVVAVLIAAFFAAEPEAVPPCLPPLVVPDAARLVAAAARIGEDRSALSREAAARREAAGWLEALRRTLWSEADRAAQAEARLRALESRQAEASRAGAAPDPALAERLIHLEETLAARDAYIHKLHHSKSWAVTAPLRNFSRLLRRG